MDEPIEKPIGTRRYLDPNTGKLVTEPIASGDPTVAVVQGLAQQQAEDQAEEKEPLDERTEALGQMIVSAKEMERTQIAQTICAFSEDCKKYAEDLTKAGERERKRMRRTGHVTEGEAALLMQRKRAAKFKIMSRVALDIAYKIEMAWGREEDGTPMDKVDHTECNPIEDGVDLRKAQAKS